MGRGVGEESHGIYSRSRNLNLPQVTAAGSTKPTVPSRIRAPPSTNIVSGFRRAAIPPRGKPPAGAPRRRSKEAARNRPLRRAARGGAQQLVKKLESFTNTTMR
jgi:hypothetical protein